MDENPPTFHILVVEDDHDLRRLTGRVLTDAGYEVAEAATGLEGLACAQTQQPDLILLDLILPDLDGIEVCRRLRADPATANAAILVITAYDAESARRAAALEAGADGYLLRPLPNHELVARIGAQLRLKRSEARLRAANARLEVELAERLRAEEALRQAEASYREMVEHAAIGIFRSTPEGRYISVNPAMARIYGYASPAEMIACVGDQIATRIHCGPDARARWLDAMHRAGILTDFETQNRRKDGSLIWTHTNARVVRDANGAVLCYEGFVEDITRRKQMEAEIAQSQQNLQAFFDAIADLVLVVGAEGRIVGANAAARARLGYTQEELGQMNVLDLHPPELRQEAAAIVAQMLAGETAQCLLPVVTKSGEILQAETRVSRGRWNHQDVVFGVTRDITERVRVELALRKSEALYRALAETAHDLIFVVNRQGRVEYVNRFAAAQLGRAPEDLIGCTARDLFAPEAAERLDRNVQEVFTTGEAHYVEAPFVLAGRQAWLGAWLAPIVDGDAISSVLGVARDLTERKQIELALARQAEALMRSNAELESFAYAASHDLQEPLRMVASFVGLLKERYQGRLDSDADEFIAFAVDGARRMQRMIDDLLEYARVTTRGQPLQPTDAGAALADALWNLGLAIAEAGATVTYDPLPTVLADPTQLTQLFQNLIGNAIKFHGSEPPRVHVAARPMEDGGSALEDERSTMEDGRWRMDDGRSLAGRAAAPIAPPTSHIAHRTSHIAPPTSHIVPHPSAWVFSVRDNGIGIDPGDHERIFGVFQRLHTQQEYPGSGIGLATCKKIVERHGGRIWVESQPGQGATFYFTLSAA